MFVEGKEALIPTLQAYTNTNPLPISGVPAQAFPAAPGFSWLLLLVAIKFIWVLAPTKIFTAEIGGNTIPGPTSGHKREIFLIQEEGIL